MDATKKCEKRTYTVLVFVDVDKRYYSLDREERERLTRPHVEELSKSLKDVSITTLKNTGLSTGFSGLPKDVMIEVLESDNLQSIERMIENYKATEKAQYGTIAHVLVTEKCMELKQGEVYEYKGVSQH